MSKYFKVGDKIRCGESVFGVVRETEHGAHAVIPGGMAYFSDLSGEPSKRSGKPPQCEPGEWRKAFEDGPDCPTWHWVLDADMRDCEPEPTELEKTVACNEKLSNEVRQLTLDLANANKTIADLRANIELLKSEDKKLRDEFQVAWNKRTADLDTMQEINAEAYDKINELQDTAERNKKIYQRAVANGSRWRGVALSVMEILKDGLS